jgi:hypothetical protein
MKKKKEEVKFEVKDKRYFIAKMDSRDLINGRKVYTKSFKKAVEDGAILKRSLDEHMRKQGLWDDEKQEEYTDLIRKSADLEYKIKSGQFKKASQLKEKALELKKLRQRTSEIMSVRNSMDSITAEGQADNDQFNYFVSVSVYDYLTQKPVFSSLEDYEASSDSDLAVACAKQFASYYYELEENYQDSFLENKLLKKLNLISEDGFLVNSGGQRVDEEGNLLDEEGARIDDKGNRIDINNNPILNDNALDELEFEDDLGGATKEKQKKAPRTTKKKKVEEQPTS